MRYLSLVRAAPNQGPPSQALMDAMAKLMADSFADGTLVQTGGLAASSLMTRVRVAGGKITVIDGPYAEAKEVIGGYAMLESPTLEGAIKSAREFLKIHADHWPGWVGECELRQIDYLAP
ncbi:MAG: YciI family protein [Gemmatimonadota bacterium]